MEDVPLHIRMNVWMQHDGAPPHYALCSRKVMNEIFDEKWIGRGGPVAWPTRSPDLTSPDYFLWGFVKERVMAVAPSDPRTWEMAAPTIDPTSSWLFPRSTAIGGLNKDDTMNSWHLW